MLLKIYRYVLDKRNTRVEVPAGAQILKVGFRRKTELSVWMVVDTEEEATEEIEFKLVRTDEEIPMEAMYLDTVEVEENDFIYHVFASYV